MGSRLPLNDFLSDLEGSKEKLSNFTRYAKFCDSYLSRNGIFLFVIKDIFCMSNDKNFFALRPNYFGLRPVLRDFLA